MIGSNLLRYNKNQKYLIPDTESEGLNLFFHRPWQISYLVADSKSVIYSENIFVKWDDINVTEDAARVTHFNLEEYKKKAISPEQAIDKFFPLLYSPEYRVVGHNVFFDGHMFNNLARAVGKKEDNSWMDRMIDTFILSKAFKKGFKPDLENFLEWHYKVYNYREKGLKTSLGVMCREFGIEYDTNKAHDASVDIIYTYELFKKLLWNVEI